MKLVKKDFICPYCFSKQDLYRIKFRCQNSPAKCSPEVDNEYAIFRGSSPMPMNKVFDIPLPKIILKNLNHCNCLGTLNVPIAVNLHQ